MSELEIDSLAHIQHVGHRWRVLISNKGCNVYGKPHVLEPCEAAVLAGHHILTSKLNQLPCCCCTCNLQNAPISLPPAVGLYQDAGQAVRERDLVMLSLGRPMLLPHSRYSAEDVQVAAARFAEREQQERLKGKQRGPARKQPVSQPAKPISRQPVGGSGVQLQQGPAYQPAWAMIQEQLQRRGQPASAPKVVSQPNPTQQ